MSVIKRGKFLKRLLSFAIVLPIKVLAKTINRTPGKSFSFIFLGDLHFDKLIHHDMEYLRQKFPNDINQIENYSRITHENLPSLMMGSKAKAQEVGAHFYLQIGDFVEGLCGSKELATLQTEEFIRFVDQHQFKMPFVVTKGNHDITGAGAKDVYRETILPWQSKQLNQPVVSSNNVLVHNNARFILFDCFSEKESLAWLKAVLNDHKKNEVLFFCTHIPVIPYNARANWLIFGHQNQQKERQELLQLLAEHKAIILSGHLHKTSIVTRKTPYGNVVQVGLGSVVGSLDAPVKDHLRGTNHFSADLVNLEPTFSPDSLELRKKMLEDERPHILHYEYADFCGYGLIEVIKNNTAVLSIFTNADTDPWTTVNLTGLLDAKSTVDVN